MRAKSIQVCLKSLYSSLGIFQNTHTQETPCRSGTEVLRPYALCGAPGHLPAQPSPATLLEGHEAPPVAHGFFATTRPFSQTYTGVPYIRAVLRAAWADLRSDLPTCLAKSTEALDFLAFVMVLSPVIVELRPSCRRQPRHLPDLDTHARSCSTHGQNV
jgi:hypothetical protein